MRALLTLVAATTADVVGNEHIAAMVVVVWARLLATPAIQVLLAHRLAISSLPASLGTRRAWRQVVPTRAGTSGMLVSPLPLGTLR